MEKIIEEIAVIIEEISDIPADEIKEDSLIIDDLELSSLEILSIVSETMRKYSIKISGDELLSIKTVGDFAQVVAGKLSDN